MTTHETAAQHLRGQMAEALGAPPPAGTVLATPAASLRYLRAGYETLTTFSPYLGETLVILKEKEHG